MKPSAFLIHVACIGMLASFPVQARQADLVNQMMHEADKSRLIVVGEMHGTREVPALVAEMADRWSAPRPAKAQALVVALEYPQIESVHLQAYFDSDGGEQARNKLLATPFWTRPAQDGRSSHAMLALIESVRKAGREGRLLKLAAFDMNAAQEAARVDRDEAMAQNLRAIVAANPSARVLALAGNYHARQRDGAPWNASQRFMAGHLLDLAPYSINIDGVRGAYWACFSGEAADCKTQSFARDPAKTNPVGVYADKALLDSGYDLGLMLDALSVSLPANRDR